MDSSFNRRLDGLVVEAGMCTGLALDSISDHHKGWFANQWAGHLYRIRGATSNNNQVMGVIGGNSATALFLQTGLREAVESPLDSAYEILSLKSNDSQTMLDLAILDALSDIQLSMRRLVVGMSLTTDRDLTETDGLEIEG